MIADHVVDASWRHAHADAIDHQIDAVRECLGHLTNVEELLDARGDDGAAEVRALSARLRERANDWRDEARALRAAGRE